MTVSEAVRIHFAGCPFGEPCSETEIERAESILHERLPDPLRELYLTFNGFCGPALASFFWPLFTTADSGYGLVEINLDLREDTVSGYPPLIFDCLFFGGNEKYWGIKRDLPDSIIAWEAQLHGFQIVGRTALDVWLAEKKCYDELDNDRNA